MRTPLLLLVCLVGCSSKPAGPVPGDIQYSLTVHVPAGGEMFQCQYVTTPMQQRYLLAAAHHYTPGSHHMLLYRTDLSAIPAGQSAPQDCYEGGGGTIMSHVRGVLYGSQVPDDSYSLPDGIAMPLAPGEVLLLQAHYINATPKALDATVDVGLTTTSDKSKMKYAAGILFYYDVFIDVPPMAKATAGERCTLNHDITLLSVFPHYHARGYGYEAWVDKPGQAPSTAPFYTSTDWEHPTKWTGGPLALASGTSIRWRCEYQSQDKEYFQGPSAVDNEMCMFTGLYYPAVDNTFDLCLDSFDQVGQGTATCADTTNCIAACPAVTAPPAGGDPRTEIPGCWQKCVVQSCPGASKPLVAELKCFAQCQGCSGSACQQCVLSKCINELTACNSAACN
jgi:hypothetical protein